jgi:transketolase
MFRVPLRANPLRTNRKAPSGLSFAERIAVVALIAEARKTHAVISAENAQINGGLGAAVAETLLEAGYSGKSARIGIRDEFGEVGTQDYLVKHFGLGAENLAEKAEPLLK